MASNGNGNGTAHSGDYTRDRDHWHAATPNASSVAAPIWLPISPDDVHDADAGPSSRMEALLMLAGLADSGQQKPGAVDAVDALGGSTPAETIALIKAALADHDTIMSASFAFSDVARCASRSDFMALLDHDDDNAPADPSLAALQAEIDRCAFTRWRARLTWLAEVPTDERTLIDELERLIVEPAVTWRELELEWQEASAVALAATATATAAPTVVCLDARTANRVEIEQIGEQTWKAGPAGDPSRGRLALSLFGIPAGYSRYRLVLFTGQHLRKLLDPSAMATTSDDPDAVVMPSLDLLESHAPELLARLLPGRGLPSIALPWFAGRLTPYGEKSALSWTSPPVGPVRLRGDDIILVCIW